MITGFDILNSFIVEFKSQLSNYDIENYKQFSVTTEGTTFDKMMSMVDPSVYNGYIDRALKNLSNFAITAGELNDFFSKVYSSVTLADKGIAIPLYSDDDIEKIRPEYFSYISTEVENDARSVLAGKMKETDIKKKYAIGEYFDKIKKQIVKTSLTVDSVRDIMVLGNPSSVVIDNVFIQNNAIPFMRSFPQHQKELNTIAMITKTKITEIYLELRKYFSAIDNMMNSGKLTDHIICRRINYMRYNVMRHYMNLCSYVSAMLIRKIAYFSFNMRAYTNLHDTIFKYFPEGDMVLHESVMDGDIKSIDDGTLLMSVLNNDISIILPHINSAIGKKRMELSNLLVRKYHYKLDYTQEIDNDKYPYDSRMYAMANKSVIEIASDMQKIGSVELNPEFVADELIENIGINHEYVEKYSNVLSNIPDIQYYSSQSEFVENNMDLILAIMNDLDHFPKNFGIICSNCTRVYKYAMSIIDGMSVNNTELDDNTFGEFKEFVEDVMNNYKDYVLHLTKKLLSRLDNLTDLLDVTNPEPTSEPEEFNPYEYAYFNDYVDDYALEGYLSKYEYIEAVEKEIMESMMRDYNKKKEFKDRGVKIIYEDENNQPTQPSGTNTQSQQSTNDQPAKPSVVADTNNNTSANNNSNNQSVSGPLQSFINALERLFERFTNNSKAAIEGNAKFFEKYKDYFDNPHTNGVNSVNVYTSEKITTKEYQTDITSIISSINGISANNLPSSFTSDKAESQIEKAIIKCIPSELAGLTDLTKRAKHFYLAGNNPKPVITEVIGEDNVREKITHVINFCRNYDKFYEEVEKKVTELQDAVKDKQSEIDIAVKNSNGKHVDITDPVQLYIRGLFAACSQVYGNYMSFLRQLAEKTKNNNPQPNDQNNDNNQQPTNQNNDNQTNDNQQ